MGEEKAIIFPCFGGSSNVGVVTALATLEAVTEVGLDKAWYRLLSNPPYTWRFNEITDKQSQEDYIWGGLLC